jgi:hypothetical protein
VSESFSICQRKEFFMKKTLKLSGILIRRLCAVTLAAVIGFLMTACASVPDGAEESTLTPDDSSAIVYFLQPSMLSGGGDIVIWDGESPVGKIYGGLNRNVACRAEPGAHCFMANRFNWSTVKVEIQANNVYYISLNWAPNPLPFTNAFVILELKTQKDGQEQFMKNEKTIAFTDDWRKEFINSLSKEDLAKMRESLNDAKKQ